MDVEPLLERLDGFAPVALAQPRPTQHLVSRSEAQEGGLGTDDVAGHVLRPEEVLDVH